MQTMEKNRHYRSCLKRSRQSTKTILHVLKKQIDQDIATTGEALIAPEQEYQTIFLIDSDCAELFGKVVATTLSNDLPELGTLNSKQAAVFFFVVAIYNKDRNFGL